MQRVASFQDSRKSFALIDMSHLERYDVLWQHRIVENREKKSFSITFIA